MARRKEGMFEMLTAILAGLAIFFGPLLLGILLFLVFRLMR
jgi:hypothetical protein